MWVIIIEIPEVFGVVETNCNLLICHERGVEAKLHAFLTFSVDAGGRSRVSSVV
jgi:hypothetical protein